MTNLHTHSGEAVYLPIPVEAPALRRRRALATRRLPLPLVTGLLFAFTLVPVALAMAGG